MGRLELGFSQPECSALTTSLWDTYIILNNWKEFVQIEYLENWKRKVLFFASKFLTIQNNVAFFKDNNYYMQLYQKIINNNKSL